MNRNNIPTIVYLIQSFQLVVRIALVCLFLGVITGTAQAVTLDTFVPLAAVGDGDGWNAITYGNGMFVAVGSTGTDRVMTSPDGVTWTARSAAENDDYWTSVTYGNGMFVAVGTAGTDRVMTSSDGITWATTTAAGDDDEWYSVTYANGLFVAVGAGLDYVVTSPDGVTWTVQTAPAEEWSSVTYGNGLFVAVGIVANIVMTSPDGITWTTRTATGNGSWYSVTYGNGLFVAVGLAGSYVMTSPDGIIWTPRIAVEDDDHWYSVTYANGLFVAVGVSNDRVMTSPDGVTWTAQTAAGDDDFWTGVTYGNGVFVAVATMSTSTIMVASSSAWTLEQTGFQFRNDNGSETAATAIGGQNSTIVWGVNTPVRFRTQVSSSIGTTTTPYAIQYKQTTDTQWHTVGVDDSFPTIVATSSGRDAGNATSHTISLPGGMTGDLLLVVFSHDGVGTSRTTSTGWNKLGEQSNTIIVSGAVYWKFATGGDTLTVTTTASEEASYIVHRIRGAGVPSASIFNGSGTNSNPPLHTTDKLRNYLWITSRSGDSTVAATVAPTNFIGFSTVLASTTGGATTNTAFLYSAATSTDPGTFTSATEQWVSFTIAIPPAATPTTGNIQLAASTTAVATNDTGYGSIAWTGTSSIASSNDTRASVTLSSTTASNYLLASGFGFTIPNDATITGIDAYVEKIQTGGTTGNVRDSSVRLVKAGSVAGNNLAVTGTNWQTTETVAQYGSSTALWGTTWTPAEVNASNFGLAFSAACAATGQNRIANIDQIILNVYYTIPAPIQLASSSYIATGGATTTAQLLAPGSATSSAFTGGRIADDTNPTPTITIPTGAYSELEWNLIATSTATSGMAFDVRLAIGATAPLSEYTAAAVWRIATTSASSSLLLSGTVYSDTGSTTASAGVPVVAVVGLENPVMYATTTSTNGAFSVTASAPTTGTEFILRPTPIAHQWQAVTYSSDSNLFVAVAGATSGGVVMTSPDGITWTGRSAAGNDDTWYDVTYGNGVFVAVGSGPDRVMTSPDGITWATSSAAGNNDSWTGVTYGNGVFVAVGYTGDRVMTSPDGITWTVRTAAGDNDSWADITFGAGLFVAVGDTTGDRVMTSTNGTTWATSSAAGNDDFWTGVTYGNNMFVAVGMIGDRVMTSTNGTTWATSSAAGNDDTWYDVTYGDGVFIAVGSGSDTVMTSSNAVTWTVRAVATAENSWSSVTYGNGRFVGVRYYVMNFSTGVGVETPLMFYVNDSTTTPATTFVTGNAGSASLAAIPLYRDTVVVYNATTSATSSVTDFDELSFFDSADDGDVLYTASTTGTTTIAANLITATGTVQYGGAGLTIDGSTTVRDRFLLAGATAATTSGLTITSSGDFSAPEQFTIAGDFAQNGQFDTSSGTLTFTGADAIVSGSLVDANRLGDVVVEPSVSGSAWTARSAAGNNDDWWDITYGAGLFVAVGGNTGSTDIVMTSPDGITWTARSAAGNNDDWYGVTYGNGRFVAVGTGSTTVDRFMYSSDGITWTPVSVNGDTDYWGNVIYADNKFVAVGGSVVAYSSDGITWSTSTEAVGGIGYYEGLTYGNGLFVAVGPYGYGSGYSVMTSPDGITWTGRDALNNDDDWYDVTYANGLFVAVAEYSTDEASPIMTSPDGITWTAVPAQEGYEPWYGWYGVAYGDGKFVAVGQYGALTSSHELTLTSNASTTDLTIAENSVLYSSSTLGVAGNVTNYGQFDNEGALYLTGAGASLHVQADLNADAFIGNTIISGSYVSLSTTTTGSLNLLSGSSFTAPSSTLTIKGNLTQSGSFTANGGQLALAGSAPIISGNVVAANSLHDVSIEPTLSWTARTAAGNNDNWRSIAYGSSTFVAVASCNGTTLVECVMTSSDGITWTVRSAAGNNDSWRSVTYGNGLFVAVADSGDHRVMYSSDGISWTAGTAVGTGYYWESITYGNGLFVAVNDSGTNAVMTSSNGTSWTARSAAGNNDGWLDVTYGNGLFVAVADSGTDRVMTSPDGTTWTARTSPGTDNRWAGIAYGNSKFVAVSYSGTDRVMTSSDGTTWATTTAAGNDDGWRAITYGNGLFVAVGTLGDRVMTSPNSITWTTQSVVGANDQWWGVILAGGQFVAVGVPEVGFDRDVVMSASVSDLVATLATNASTTDLSIAGGTTFAAASSTISIAGDYANTGTFTASTSKVIFVGTGLQTATGTMTGTSQFYDLSILNTSGSGSSTQSVTFGAPLSATGTFMMVASTSAAFAAGTTSSFNNVTLQGGSAVSEVWLRSTAGGSQWYLDIEGTQAVSYVNVKDSNAIAVAGGVTHASSTNSGNNTNWGFGDGSVWNATDWTSYETVTIDESNIDADLTNFPVYVNLADLSAQFWTTVRDGGVDIRVTTDSGSPVELARDVVSASTTAETGELHFLAPSISSTTDTIFRIYYNGVADGYASTSSYGAQAVWNDYTVVWHMNELLQSDSTGNLPNRMTTGTFADPVLTNGNIVMDSNDELEVTSATDGAGALEGSYSDWSAMTFWNEAGGTTAGTVNTTGASHQRFMLYGIDLTTGSTTVRSGGGSISTVAPVVTGTGTHVIHAAYSNATGLISVYGDGVLIATTTGNAPTIAWDGWNVYRLLGTHYESRGAQTAFSAARVKAEYINFSTTTNFYTIGIPPPTEWNSTDWTLYDAITIESDQVDADLTDFPVYVDLADLSSQFWSTVAAGGGDIRVTTDSGSPVELPREVVSASTTAETGELHFKAGTISSTTDTVFRIYYNGVDSEYATSSTYGAQNVWTNGFVAVYHIEEDGAVSDYADSTRYGNTAASENIDAADRVTGAVGTAVNLDGSPEGATIVDHSSFDFGSSLTVSAWAQTDTLAVDGGVVAKGSGGSDTILMWFDEGVDDFTCGMMAGGSFVNSSVGGSYTARATGAWYHSLCTYTGSTFNMYVNAATNYSAAKTGAVANTTAIPTFGRDSVSRYLNGRVDEVRFATTSRSAAWVSAEYVNQSTSTDFYTVNLAPAVGSSTLAAHTAGQVANAFNFQNQTDAELFAFRLLPNSGTSTVANVVLTLSGVHKVNPVAFTNVRLYRDLDSDAQYDATDVQVGGAGAVSLSGQAGTVTFTTDFQSTTSQDYIMTADFEAPQNGAFLTINLPASGLTITDGQGAQTVTGTTLQTQHGRNNKGAGGVGDAEIGGSAPSGAGVQTGGGNSGGQSIDTNTGGTTIGNDPGFFWPAAHGAGWNNSSYAYDQVNGTYATTAAAISQSYYNHNFGIPTGNQITGIEIKLELSGTTAAGSIAVNLSWDGGTSWTSTTSTQTLTTTDAVRTLGGASDLWGHAWTRDEFSDANFRVRLTGVPSANTIQVDAIQARIYHQSGGGGGGGGGEL